MNLKTKTKTKKAREKIHGKIQDCKCPVRKLYLEVKVSLVLKQLKKKDSIMC